MANHTENKPQHHFQVPAYHGYFEADASHLCTSMPGDCASPAAWRDIFHDDSHIGLPNRVKQTLNRFEYRPILKMYRQVPA